MKVLFLILSSDGPFPVYAKMREVWRTYMKSHPDIECYFIEHRSDRSEIVCEGDTILIPGQEAYETILRKTIEALRWCMNRKNYDFVVRTNLSSVWNFSTLMNRLETMPTANLYSGEINWGRYVSGAGILMSADVCRRLTENPIESRGDDDESIGVFLMSQGVPMHSEARYNMTFEDSETIPTGYYHYRAKHPDLSRRNEEPRGMFRVLSKQPIWIITTCLQKDANNVPCPTTFTDYETRVQDY